MSRRAVRPAVQDPIVVAPRDASFYERPDTRWARVYHVATVDWTAACQPGSVFAKGTTPLVESLAERRPGSVYDDLRCQRPGCRVWWALVPPKPRPGASA